MEGHHIGPALNRAGREGPVIAIGPEDHHGLGRIKHTKTLSHMGLIPVLPRNRPRITGQPVLVIGHQHQAIRGLLQLGERPIGIVHRGGDPDLSA